MWPMAQRSPSRQTSLPSSMYSRTLRKAENATGPSAMSAAPPVKRAAITAPAAAISSTVKFGSS